LLLRILQIAIGHEAKSIADRGVYADSLECKVAEVLESLQANDAIVVSELSRLGGKLLSVSFAHIWTVESGKITINRLLRYRRLSIPHIVFDHLPKSFPQGD
jgi:hypothetical protein